MLELDPTSQPYAAAILAVGTAHPTLEEVAFIQSLSLDQVKRPHVAFASYIRRLAEGEDAETLCAYLEPVAQIGELPAARAAVVWLCKMAEAQQCTHGTKVH